MASKISDWNSTARLEESIHASASKRCRSIFQATAQEEQKPLVLNLERPCPATALYVLARLHEHPVAFSEIVSRMTEHEEGVSGLRLCEIAHEMGFALDAVELRPKDLDTWVGPFIAFFQPREGLAHCGNCWRRCISLLATPNLP
jgi:hypothetical protein